MARSRKPNSTSNRAASRSKRGPKSFSIPADAPSLQVNSQARDKYYQLIALILLVGFGIYVSVLYFGHQVVPNSDFPAFVNTAHELLSFQEPSSFKRVPGLGLLQVGLSHLVGGQHPELTAGWLLNALLYPLTALLLYLLILIHLLQS